MEERYSRNIHSVSAEEQAALAARERVRAVNPTVAVRAVEAFLDGENAGGLVRGQDLVLDALDSVPARLLLEDACAREGVTIVHGAIQGWSAQVSVVPAGSGLLRRLSGSQVTPREKSSLPFTPPPPPCRRRRR